MLLRMGESIIETTPEQLEPVVSRRSGQQLERFCFEHMIRGEELNNSFLNLLDQAKKDAVVSIDTEQKPLKRYEIINNSYIYSGNAISQDTIFTHIIELQEEDLKVAALIINGCKVVPYAYREEYDETGLVIRAKARLNEKTLAELEPLMRSSEYLKVVRKGLDSEPKLMRFTTCKWSRDEKSIKQELNLVEKSLEQTLPEVGIVGVDRDDLNEVREQLLINTVLVDQLLEQLVSKDILNKAEAFAFKEQAAVKAWETLRESDRVDDIDN